MASAPPPTPPAHQPPSSVWRRFRSAPKWAQISAWSVAVIVVLIVIAAAAGAAEEEKATVAAKTITQRTATTAAATPEPAPESPDESDTGRMSDGEFELASSAIDQATDEILAYGEALGGECAALFSALEAAAAIECVKEGYDGVEGDLAGVVAQIEDVRGDVAKQCRAAVERVYKVANVPLFRALRASRDAFVTIDGEGARRTSARLKGEIERWTRVVLDFRVECSPS